MDDAAKIAATLVQAIRRLRQKNTQFPGRHDTALQQLAEIFQHATTKTPTQEPTTQQSYKVKANRNRNTTPYCAAVIHPISGETIQKYKKLAADPATQALWTTEFGK